MKKPALFAVVAACALSATTKSLATPVAVTLTLTSSSGLNALLDAGLTTATLTSTLSGTQGIVLDDGAPISTELSFTGGLIMLPDQSFILSVGGLGQVLAGLQSVVISGLTSTGTVPLTHTGGVFPGPVSYIFDPGDPNGTHIRIDPMTMLPIIDPDTMLPFEDPNNVTSAVISGGNLTYIGSGQIALLVGSGTLDFSTDPAAFDLPPLGPLDVRASLTQTFLGSTGVTSTYNVVLSSPISFSDLLVTDGITLEATLIGQIVATGTYTLVPEPSTFILAAIGLAALIPYARHRLRGTRTG